MGTYISKLNAKAWPGDPEPENWLVQWKELTDRAQARSGVPDSECLKMLLSKVDGQTYRYLTAIEFFKRRKTTTPTSTRMPR